MCKSILYLLLLIILSGCSFNLKDNESIAIDLFYTQTKFQSHLANSQLEQFQFAPYQQQKIFFDNNINTAIFNFKVENNAVLDNEAVVVVAHKYFNDVSYITQYSDGSFSKVEKLFRVKPTANRIFSSEKFVFNFHNKLAANHFLIVNSYANSKLFP
ncbi:hypothetical protein MNBD_GAMMA01-1910 [hydrothermal vent metagenome]|uniref:Lipoprotein n=1 Tax=hydrothermal vent metagenome TaxID=652676 RepID=A0A3B0UYG1_9ZZZZ